MRICTRELAALGLVITATLPWDALASNEEAVYPQRPITLVVGYPPGGSADALARLLARHMGEVLGQRMIIEYKPGATGNIGAESVAGAAPDGYTVFLGERPNTIHKALYGHMKYDFSQDLAPLALVATMPYVMVAGVHTPIATVQDLVGLARTYPGGLTCASAGIGSGLHLLCELLQQEVGIDMLHVPYHGSAPGLTDVIGGRIDMQISTAVAALPHIQAGKLRPLAVMSGERLPALPNVPTIAEAGVPGLALGGWYGLLAPSGTPANVVATLNQGINAILRDPALHEAMAQLTFAPPHQPNTAEAFRELIAQETKLWTAILRTHNIKPLH